MVATSKSTPKSETQPLRQRPGIDLDNTQTHVGTNPYADNSLGPGSTSAILYSKFKSVFFLAVSLYFLDMIKFYHNIVHSSHIRHGWWSIGLAFSVAILLLKSYTELYQGKIKKATVNYSNFRQTTHLILLLLFLTSICFHVALWPVYGSQTFLIAFFVGFGVVLQLMLIFPVTVQNFVGIVGFTFYIQQYGFL